MTGPHCGGPVKAPSRDDAQIGEARARWAVVAVPEGGRAQSGNGLLRVDQCGMTVRDGASSADEVGGGRRQLLERGMATEELAAFEDLVRKKGIPIGISFASLTRIIGPSRAIEEIDKDDWDGDGTDEDGDIDDWDGDGTDEDGDIDVFEDALEELAP